MEALKKTISTLKNTLFEDKYFIYLSILFFVFLALYWGRFGNPVIDCGREAYIPFAMADLGKVLFKDIVCIYGPVPYYLNALFVKLFGAHLNTMYSIGALLSYIFLFGIYNLAKRFLNVRLAFLYACIIIFCCILNPSISNSIFAYSYAIVYALVFAVFHLIFLFKFIDGKKAKNLYISAFLLSFCLLSKFDFIPCILPFLIALLKYRKNLNLKTIIRILTSFFTPFLIIALILICQKVSLQNLFFNFKMISNMAHSPSLQYFYTVCTGYFFDFKKTFKFVLNFLFSSLIFVAMGFFGYLASKTKNAILNAIAFFVIICFSMLLLFNNITYIFLYLPLLLLFFLIVKFAIFTYKKIKIPEFKISDDDTIFFIFILFSLLFSLKTLFGLFHELYGAYYLPFILLSFAIVVFSLSKKRSAYIAETFKTTAVILITAFVFLNFLTFVSKDTAMKTPAGLLYTDRYTAVSMNKALIFLKENIKGDETVLVLPEGLIVNFILKKESPFYNTSFTPLDFDAYSEDYLTEMLSTNAPRYLMFILRDYSDYGKNSICKDFGQKFCKKINKLYDDKDILDDNTFSLPKDRRFIKIFERKNND